MRWIRTVIGLKGLMVCLVFVGVSGLVIIDAAAAAPSLFRLEPICGGGPGKPFRSRNTTGAGRWRRKTLCHQRRADICGKRHVAGSCSGEAANHNNSW